MHPDGAVRRAGKGLVQVDGQWELMERVAPDELSDWKQEKQTGAGRDRRIACHLETNGTRFASEAQAMTHWMPEAKDKESLVKVHMPGPSAGREFFLKLTQSGLSLAQYDSQWRQRSGVPENGMAARLHSALVEILRWLVTVDQLDPTQIVAPECTTRELLRLEVAVNRNPRQPDWEGLEAMVCSPMTTLGAVQTPAFTAWVAATQKDQAVFMKQSRLLRDEKVLDARRRGDKGKGKKDKDNDKEE